MNDFSPRLFREINNNETLLSSLLFYVASGNQDAAEKILKKYPELMVAKGSVIDFSKREFINISPFELILWTFDVRYMLGMFIKCLPTTIQGKKIALELLKQYNDAKVGHVLYKFNGDIYKEKHFDPQPLFEAMQTYVDFYDQWSEQQRSEHWCKVVGMKQRLLPAYIRQHICDPNKRPRHFDAERFTRYLSFGNSKYNKSDVWDDSCEGLGVDFAISLYGRCNWARGDDYDEKSSVEFELSCLKTLFEAREQDCLAVEEKLLQSISQIHSMLFSELSACIIL